MLTQEPEQPWQIACESDEKKDAIAAFNSAWKAAKRALIAALKGGAR